MLRKILRINEFQAKGILSENGIPVPNCGIAYSACEAVKISKEIGFPVAIKAQVPLWGRGSLGGVRFADNQDEAFKTAGTILGSTLKGWDVNCILIEEKIPVKHEYYVSATLDYSKKCPVILASSRGGVDIERTALKSPEHIVEETVDIDRGLPDFHARRIAKKVNLKGKNMLSFASIIKSLYGILMKYDATLVEVNPLAFTFDNSLIALDAKMILDENASFKNRIQFLGTDSLKQKLKEGAGKRKALSKDAEIPTYIELDGNIGIIADGAGTGMLTLDLTKEHGGDVEVYCELGGRATPELIEEAMDIVLSNKKVRVLLINLIGGLNRMDEMAEGIKSFVSKKKTQVEIVVRMSGTFEEEGRSILRETGIASYQSIYNAIEKTMKLTGII